MLNEAGLSKPFVRAPKLQDCIELSNSMREEDKREIWHYSRVSPLVCLIDGLTYGEKCWTVEYNGSVIAMFGVTRQDEITGIPWMLASEDLKKIKKSFLRECHQYVERMFDGFQVLKNCAWSQNTIHIQWLKWLGFRFFPAQPKGYDGELFYEFYKVK
jgi:hypothetical protein